MNDHKFMSLISLVPIAAIAVGLNACQQEVSEPITAERAPTESISGKPTPVLTDQTNTSPGKPSAPVNMRYEVLGNPVVGSPVAVNVEFSAAEGQGPVQIRYSIADGSAVTFQEGQIERLEISGGRNRNRQQLMVIPQREGRIYVNVSAEVQTANGMMIKSMAIPIQVGNAPNQPTVNGEIIEGPDGETVISLPASKPPE